MSNNIELKSNAKDLLYNIIKYLIESKYTTDIIIVPEELFVYVDHSTGKEFTTASRKGAPRTDSVVILKTSMQTHVHIVEINYVIIDKSPKNETLYIPQKDRDARIEDILSRGKILNLDSDIFNRQYVEVIIDNMNRLTSSKK